MAASITAGIIFITMFVLIVSEKIERHLATLGCGALTLIFVFGICMLSAEAALSILNFGAIFTKEFWYLEYTFAKGCVRIRISSCALLFVLKLWYTIYICYIYE